jgi:hypothetical protein
MDQLPGRVVFADLDEWRRKQNDLRNGLRLVERPLAGAIAPRQLSKGAKRKAAEMAGRESMALGTQPATSKERARRRTARIPRRAKICRKRKSETGETQSWPK